jgi:hypothetical protein
MGMSLVASCRDCASSAPSCCQLCSYSQPGSCIIDIIIIISALALSLSLSLSGIHDDLLYQLYLQPLRRPHTSFRMASCGFAYHWSTARVTRGSGGTCFAHWPNTNRTSIPYCNSLAIFHAMPTWSAGSPSPSEPPSFLPVCS